MNTYINENGTKVNYNRYEAKEIELINKFIEPEDCVLELGARYGGTSCTINKILTDKTKQVSVEPDEKVWEALEINKKNNDCHFDILKGTISKEPQRIVLSDRTFGDGNEWATYTEPASGYSSQRVANYPLPLLPFNVLFADCEGFLETFYEQNKELFPQLRMIIIEKDRPEACDYNRIINIFHSLGFKTVIDGFHSVFIKSN